MNIDYSINLGKPSVKSLIKELQRIVDTNPDINSHKVGIRLNEGYIMDCVELAKWDDGGKQRVWVDIY